MERTRPRDNHLRGRLSLEQRERFDAAASPAERDALIEEVRRTHVEEALAAAARILDRLARGEEPHTLRRELRATGVLVRRSANNKKSHDEEDSHA